MVRTVQLILISDLLDDALFAAADKVRPFAGLRRGPTGLVATVKVTARDDDLAVLAQVPGLTSVRLDRNRNVTDAGLAHLKRLTGLTTLDLRFTMVTDEGLKHLHGLRALKGVQLEGSQATPEGVEALRKALPTATILGP
jgi:hypothetical protein